MPSWPPAEGLFGQPAFDTEAMRRWAAALAPRLPGSALWWGASPVLSERSMRWWERVNGVVFPADFRPTLEDWQRRLPQLLDCAAAGAGHLYVMPIKAPLEATLAPLMVETLEGARLSAG